MEIPTEILDFAINQLKPAADFKIAIHLDKIHGDRIRTIKHEVQTLDQSAPPKRVKIQQYTVTLKEWVIEKRCNFLEKDKIANIAYCKNSNTLVFGKYRL